MVSKVSAANNASVVSNTWGEEEMKGVLPGERLMRICRWMSCIFTTGSTMMGLHFWDFFWVRKIWLVEIQPIQLP